MIKATSCVIFFCLSLQAFAISDKLRNKILKGEQADEYLKGTDEIHIDKDTRSAAFIKFTKNETPIAFDLVQQLKMWYELNEKYSFELIRIDKDDFGFEHHRFQQMYLGYPVKDMVVYVHVKDGKVEMVNGQLETRFEQDFSFSLGFLNALEIAKDHIAANEYKWNIRKEERLLNKNASSKKSTYFPSRKLVLTPQNGNFKNAGNYHLCYELDLFAHQPESRNLVYVDAKNGSIVMNESLIRHADVEGTAETKKSGTRTFTTDDEIEPGFYVLSESGRGNGIVTYDETGTHFQDADNNWTLAEYDNAARDYAAVDAHWAAEVIYDYFLEKFNRNSYDNNGAQIQCRVHRVFDGNTNNATWNGSYISIGDAINRPSTFATLDIIAHEFTHALTDKTARLKYVQEPGALNESFSDIFGAAVEFYGKPPNQNGNWLIGEDTGFYLRSMSNPTSTYQPDTYGSNDLNWVEIDGCWPGGNNDLCGLHINSGVQNHWFYLLSNGGSGVNANGDSYNVSGIGIDKAVEIAYRNLTVYLTPDSDYEDAKTYAIQSAIDMYGECPGAQEVISTIDAWYAVGLGEKFVPDNALQPNFNTIDPLYYCSAPQTIHFNGTTSFDVDSYSWSFGDGTTSTLQNPTHTYASPGNYSVTLEVTGCGVTNNITKNAFIIIDDADPCIQNMPYSSTITETACSGILYDYGGPNKNYSDLSTGVLTIASPNNQPVTLNFTELGYEERFDSLFIYDGNSVNAPLITGLNGTFVPAAPITSTGGTITLKHFSDTYVTEKGFALTWTTGENCGFSCDDVAIQINGTTQTPSCAGNTDGSITVAVSGGNGPYTYIWNGGETSPNINNKVAGNYNITVTDRDQCTASKSFTINPSLISIDVVTSIKNETCFGESDGFIGFIDIKNGTTPYVINWSNGSTGSSTANLNPGNYTATITDRNGCVFSGTYEVLAAEALSLNAIITNSTGVNATDGSIVINVSGGNAPYRYYWSNAKTSTGIYNMRTGSYWVSVTDNSDCYINETFAIEIEEGSCPNVLNEMNNVNLVTGLKNAKTSIISNGTISAGNNVTFQAGTLIELANDFEVNKGATFLAVIGGCN